MPDQIFLKFYPRDWLGDMALNSCSLEAQGLWIRLVCLMGQGHPFGFLRSGQDKPPLKGEVKGELKGRVMQGPRLLRALGVGGLGEEHLETLLEELEEEGVFSRDEDGAIFSRRMLKDRQRYEKARSAGQRGGNPTLRDRGRVKASIETAVKDEVKPPLKPEVKGGVKGQLKLRSQKPEARSQKLDPKNNTRTIALQLGFNPDQDQGWEFLAKGTLPKVNASRRAVFGDVYRVWMSWKAEFEGDHKLTVERYNSIAKHLEGSHPAYTADQLVLVSKGVKNSEHHMSQASWCDVASIFGSGRKVDGHIDRAKDGQVQGRGRFREMPQAKGLDDQQFQAGSRGSEGVTFMKPGDIEYEDEDGT